MQTDEAGKETIWWCLPSDRELYFAFECFSGSNMCSFTSYNLQTSGQRTAKKTRITVEVTTCSRSSNGAMDHAQEEATTILQQNNAVPAARADNDAPAEASGNTETTTEAATDQAPSNPRLTAIQNKHANLTTTLADLQAERARLIAQTTLPSGLAMPDTWSEDEKSKQALSSANAVIKDHIRLLHEYNEIKDIGQGLMGLVAEGRGVRIKAVMEDFNMEEKD